MAGNDKNDVKFAFDRKIYEDSVRAGTPVDQLVRCTDGFTGEKPNIIVILTDDLGYGDLGCYGGRAIKTPHIDRMADEGMRFTDHYACSALCSPSRAGLLTGRYPHRTGVTWPVQAGNDTVMRKLMHRLGLMLGSLGVLDMRGGQSIAPGLSRSEITMAGALQVAGYKTGAIGKWHLGDFTVCDEYLPRKHGFDHFIGFNGTNDDFPVAYWRDETELVKDIGIDQEKYTGEFTREAVEFIERSKEGPFFLYLAHKDPHLPHFPSEKFKNRSEGGRYGDSVEEVDESLGEIIDCLEKNGLDDNTLVLFTSDNGPWYEGSTGGHRGRKGQSFEGGFRVPLLAWWPGRIAPGSVCRAPCMNIDFFPTVLELAGLDLPADRIIDGKSIRGLLGGEETESSHEALFFFHHNELEGVRAGDWKYFRFINTYVWPIPLDKPNHFIGKNAGGRDYIPEGSDVGVPTMASWPLLYNLAIDSDESYNLVKKHPEVAEQMQAMMETFETDFVRNPRGWK
jgi:arylsulfatase A